MCLWTHWVLPGEETTASCFCVKYSQEHHHSYPRKGNKVTGWISQKCFLHSRCKTKQVNCWQQCENAMMEHLKVKSTFFSYCFRSKHPKDWFTVKSWNQKINLLLHCSDGKQSACQHPISSSEGNSGTKPKSVRNTSTASKILSNSRQESSLKIHGASLSLNSHFLLGLFSVKSYFFPAFGLSTICKVSRGAVCQNTWLLPMSQTCSEWWKAWSNNLI